MVGGGVETEEKKRNARGFSTPKSKQIPGQPTHPFSKVLLNQRPAAPARAKSIPCPIKHRKRKQNFLLDETHR